MQSKSIEPLVELLQVEFNNTSIGFLKSLLLQDYSTLILQQESLKKEQETLTQELEELVVNDYKSLLNAHVDINHLISSFSEIPPLLENLVEYPTRVKQSLKDGEKSRQESQTLRSNLTLLSRNLEQIEPILEIPSFFDTLLRNGHHEEAMDLQLFTQRLPMRYPNLKYLTSLASLNNSQSMLTQLLSLLRGPVKLPLCIRVIGYLRRLMIPDLTLRILFLSLRNEHLTTLMAIIKSQNQTEFIKRYLQTQRDVIFDIITHYKSIFPSPGNDHILPSFTGLIINDTLTKVREYLDGLDDLMDLGSVNTQVMYYSQSLSRLGLDFRVLLVNDLHACVLRVVGRMFREAGDYRVDKGIEKGSDIIKCGLGVPFNRFMNGLNQLRYMPVITLYSELLEIMIEALDRIASSIVASELKREKEIVASVFMEMIPGIIKGLGTVLAQTQDGNEYSSLLEKLKSAIRTSVGGNSNGVISPNGNGVVSPNGNGVMSPVSGTTSPDFIQSLNGKLEIEDE